MLSWGPRSLDQQVTTLIHALTKCFVYGEGNQRGLQDGTMSMLTPGKQIIQFHLDDGVENLDNHEIEVDSLQHHPTKRHQVEEMKHDGNKCTYSLEKKSKKRLYFSTILSKMLEWAYNAVPRSRAFLLGIQTSKNDNTVPSRTVVAHDLICVIFPKIIVQVLGQECTSVLTSCRAISTTKDISLRTSNRRSNKKQTNDMADYRVFCSRYTRQEEDLSDSK